MSDMEESEYPEHRSFDEMMQDPRWEGNYGYLAARTDAPVNRRELAENYLDERTMEWSDEDLFQWAISVDGAAFAHIMFKSDLDDEDHDLAGQLVRKQHPSQYVT